MELILIIMNTKILERLTKEFTYVGDEQISGHTALKIINEVVAELTIAKEVEDAYNFITACHADIGFMGSAEYDTAKKIIADYNEKIPTPIIEETFTKEQVYVILAKFAQTTNTERLLNGSETIPETVRTLKEYRDIDFTY